MFNIYHTRLSYVEWLLRAGPRLKVVHLGSATQVTDDTFGRLVGAGHLAHLEELQVVPQKVASELHPKVRNHGEGPY